MRIDKPMDVAIRCMDTLDSVLNLIELHHEVGNLPMRKASECFQPDMSSNDLSLVRILTRLNGELQLLEARLTTPAVEKVLGLE
jgi:hypothetical protein